MARLRFWTVPAAAALAGANAVAGYIPLDGFGGPAVVVADDNPSPGGASEPSTYAVPGSGDTVQRTLTHTLTAGANPKKKDPLSSASIGAVNYPSGALSVDNTSGRNSIVEVDWSLPAGFLPLLPGDFGGSASLRLDLLFDNLGVDVALFDGTTFLASQALSPSSSPATVDLALTLGQWNAIAAGSGAPLRIVLSNSQPDWGLTLDSVGFCRDDTGSCDTGSGDGGRVGPVPNGAAAPNTPVPEPGSLALVGLALAAVAGVTRRRAT